MRVGSDANVAGYGPLASFWLLTPMLLLVCGVFVLPVSALLKTSLFDPDFTLRHYAEAFGDQLFITVFLRTVRTSLLVAVIATVLGYPVASLMARLRGGKAALVGACVLIPLWTSVLVRTYSWTVILQRNGILNKILIATGIIDEPITLIYTDTAVIIAMVHVLLPYTILPIYSSLRMIPPELRRAAENLGARGFATFWHVVLPLSLPGIASGFVMVFIVGLGYFIVPALVGGSHSMMVATLISRYVTETLNWPQASTLAGILLAFTFALMAVFNRLLRPAGLSGELR